MAYLALLNSASLYPESLFGNAISSASAASASPSSASAQNSSSLQLLDDIYTPSSSESQQTSSTAASGASAQSQSAASSAADSPLSSLLSALSSLLGNSGSQAGSSLTTALQTAEQDGTQVAEWMIQQAQADGASQSSSTGADNLSDAGNSMSSGASLVAQFASDLSQLGKIIGQTASADAGALETQGLASSSTGSETRLLRNALTQGVLGALESSIDSQAGGAGVEFSLSDSALSARGSRNGSSQLSLSIAGSNPSAGSAGSSGAYGFALEFDSSTSTALVGESSSTTGSDGSTTSTAVVAASQVEQYTMYAASDEQTGNGQTSLTLAALSGEISSTVGVGVSETTDGSASSLSAVAVEAYSQSQSLFMVNRSFATGDSESTDAAQALNAIA